MNYKHHYEKLISRGKARTLPPNVYREKHHIIPRGIGGSDAPENIVELTPEEHFVAHQLLVKIHPQELNILRACRMMCNNGTQVHRNNKLYGWLRKRLNKEMCTRVTVAGVIYESIMVAARSFNISGDMVKRRCRIAKYPDWNYTDKPFIKPVPYRSIMRISCDGKLFPSKKAAALYFGISMDVVKNRCRSSKFPDWIDLENLDKLPMTRKKAPKNLQIICDGILFNSMSDASEFFGITKNAIYGRFNSPKFYNWNYADNPILKKQKQPPVPVVCNFITYNSAKEAAISFGLTMQGVMYRCRKQTLPGWYYL